MSAPHIDFRAVPQNVPSLCIPRVFPNITEARIRNILTELNMGTIQRVDIVSKMTPKGEKFNRIFIHFNCWASNPNANTARERLLNGKEIKIIYDDPWFWKISAYRQPVQRQQQQQQVPKKKPPTLQFDEDKDKDEFGRNKSLRPQKQQQPRSPASSPPRQRPNTPVQEEKEEEISELLYDEENAIDKAELDPDNIEETNIQLNYGATEKLIPKRKPKKATK